MESDYLVEDQLLTETQLIDLLERATQHRFSAPTIARWRRGKGLPFVRIGGGVIIRYPASRVRAWLNSGSAGGSGR
jgi:hypothetical protein